MAAAGLQNSTVLDFENFALAGGAEQRIGNGYGGFNWLQAGVYNPDGAIAGYVASSGQNIAFIAEAGNSEISGYEDAARGTPLVITRDDPFILASAVFTSAFQSSLTITARAYADSAGQHLIGQLTFAVGSGNTAATSFLDGLDFGTFSGATRVEFNGNDGNAATLDYFGLDDLTYALSSRTVLTFDDIALAPGGETPIIDYQGFSFSETGAYRPDGSLPGYTASSGANIAFIAEAAGNEVSGYDNVAAGSPVVISNDSTFAFLGGNFAAAFRDNISVTIRGYSDAAGANLVAETTIVARQGSADRFNFDNGEFAGLHRLEFASNDGNPATPDYFGFDDLTFLVDPAAVLAPLIASQFLI